MSFLNTDPLQNDTEPTLLGKILQVLNNVATGSGIQVDISSEPISASGISESTVTVNGVDVSILASNAKRVGMEIQNTGTQSCIICLANAATSDGQVIQPGGFYEWENNQARYTGPVRAKWNTISTSLVVREITGA